MDIVFITLSPYSSTPDWTNNSNMCLTYFFQGHYNKTWRVGINPVCFDTNELTLQHEMSKKTIIIFRRERREVGGGGHRNGRLGYPGVFSYPNRTSYIKVLTIKPGHAMKHIEYHYQKYKFDPSS